MAGKVVFCDGEDICVFDGQKVERYTSEYITRFRDSAIASARNKEWKNSSNALYRSEFFSSGGEENLIGNVTSAFFISQDEVVYTFTIDNSSGIYKKSLSDEKLIESHVVNSTSNAYVGGSYDERSGTLAVALRSGYYNSSVALFDMKTCDYKTYTEGDTLDEDPYICPDERNIIYYSSRGVGRDMQGNFVAFSPAEIYRLDIGRVKVDLVKSDEKYSYFKPKCRGGKLYCIKAPASHGKGNVILDIVLIPWRILQAIVGFFQVFVHAFTGKSMTSGGDNPARGRKVDGRKLIISGNLVDVEKEAKKNASKRDTDYGLVPSSWQLIEVESGKVIKSGIADFDIADDGTIYATNGRRIFEIRQNSCKKICDASACFAISCKKTFDGGTDNIFDLA